MDEQRAWIRSRRKKRLRFTAVMLAFCLLVTNYPNILATLFASAAEQGDGTVYVSGFAELPEEVKEQIVPLGTEQGELSLPDTLEAFAETESTNPPEDTDPPENPEKEEEQPEQPEGVDEGQPENPEDGTNPPEDGTEEPDGEDVEQPAEEEKDDIAEPDIEQDEDNNNAEPELQNDSAPTDDEGDMLSVRSGVFVMPVYMAEPVDTVETQTLERKEETVMIQGVAWQCEPEYDGNTEGTYIFTAVLPEGYALTEGASLPQITVTVQDDVAVQALIERIAALPDVQDYMEEEPDIDDWEGDEDAYEEAYEEWMEGLLAYAEEALDIWKAYKALTQEQQAQIPEELLAKLTAWVEIAEQVAGSRKVMAAATHTCNGITFTEWSNTTTLPSSGNYYLTTNVDLGSSRFCQIDDTLNLCLNGHTISGEVSYGIIRVNGGTLNLYDCKESGKISCSEEHNPILVRNNGELNLYGGTVQSGLASAILIGRSGSDSIGGTVNVHSGATIIGGTNGILANDMSGSSSSVNIYGGSITGKGSGYPVKMQDQDGSVTISGSAAMNFPSSKASIYTVTPVVANAQVSNTYTIDYVDVTEGDTVVRGSTDTVHYKLKSSSYVLVPYGGNLIAAKSAYEVALNPNGGSGGTGLTSYTTGQGAELPTNWTKTNYVFEGWYENADLSGTKVERISKTDFGDKTYYAKWTPVSYSITYDLDGGTVSGNPTSYTIEDNAITLKNPTKTGYTFFGWSGTGLTSNSTSVTIAKGSTGNRSYTANWTAKTYTITYSGIDGATLSTKPTQHTYGTATTVGTPTKTGYTFEGWKINGAAATKTTTLGATAYTTNITLEATWTASGYTISYTLNDGTVSGNPTSYTIESSAITLKNPTKTGYTFAGWSGTGLTGTDNTSVTIAKGSTGDRSYTANWTANTYNITYSGLTGASLTLQPTKHTYGTATTIGTPTKTGYTFAGWKINNGTATKITTLGATAYTTDITLEATWTAIGYTISYTLNDGTVSGNPTSYTIESSAITLKNPSRTGYTFSGWSGTGLTGTDNTSVTIAKGSTGDRSYTAHWTANKYTITYKDKNNVNFSGTHGSNYPTRHTYGTATTLVSPTKTGYDFNGWYTKSDCTGSSVTSLGATSYTDNITLYAKWTAKTYTITYKGMTDASLNPQPTQHTYGTETTVGNPTKTGYTFAGWKVNSGSTATKDLTLGATAYTASITLTATWTADTYQISYSGIEGATLSPKPEQHTYGTETTVGNPTKPGCTFAGWKINNNSTAIGSLTLGAADYTADITLTAIWTAAAVTIHAANCTHDGADKVAESGDYTVTFAPVDGYSIPARVTVRIGGTTLASDAYTYDNTTGALTILRDKITGNIIITAKAVKDPVKSGPGKGDPDNTAPGGELDEDGSTVTYTGTYGEEYMPVIIVGGQEVTPEIAWDESKGKGEWTYRSDPDDEITVEFRKRAIAGITVTPGTLTIYADDSANESIDALTSYVKANSRAQASYDNKTKAAVQADYTNTDSFAVKGKAYNYTVSADGKTKGITLTVAPVTAAVTAPDALKQRRKAGGYTAAEVKGWLPATVTVTYTGGTTKPESRPVTWNTNSIGADFGAAMGKKTVSGTVALPAWASGENTVSIEVEFVDRNILTDAQMKLSISGWAYGAQTAPAPKGNLINVKDKDAAYTYLYSADNGDNWVTAQNLPKSGSGHIIPGTYLVEMTYTGMDYTGVKKASFTVTQKALTVKKGTLAVENRNYDGTTDAMLKEGGEPELSGMIEGDNVSLGGTLSAVFANKGPKKDISVTVTGFELTGNDKDYYRLENTTLTLKATINNADGTAPSSGSGSGNSGRKDDDGNSDGGNSGDDNGGSSDNGGSTPGDDSGSSTPAVTPPAVTAPADTPQPAPGTEDGSDKDKETQQAKSPEGTPENGAGPKDTDTKDTDKPGQNGDSTQPVNRPQPEDETLQTVPAVIADGRIVVDDGSASGEGSSTGSGNPANGGKIATGNVPGMTDTGNTPKTSTLLTVGEGAVIVTVVCEDERYAAGVRDTEAVANAVLAPEQIQLVNDGGIIEIRVDVKDISDSIPLRDKETVQKGYEAYGQYLTDLKLGAYVDISMYIKTGDSGWNAITETGEPIEVVIGIPEELRNDSREYYIIRAHEDRHDLLNDMDNVPETITIITDMFSSYAIAYRLTGAADSVYSGTNMVYGGVDIVDGRAQCRLCHICPTFRGVCCFIWLVVIVAVVTLVVLIVALGYFCITYNRKQHRERKKFS